MKSRATKGVHDTYQYLVADTAFYFTVDDGSIELHDGSLADPAATVVTDEETWADIASGNVSAAAAAKTGALTITGDPQAATRLRKLFSRRQVLTHATSTLNRDSRTRRQR